MKKLLLMGMAVAVFSACSSNQQNNGSGDSTKGDTTLKADGAAMSEVEDTDKSLCFLRTEGKDSTWVELMIKGDKVTGQMSWMPFEKDARKGKLDGMMRGDTIRATWSFMQEGTTDTLGVNFLLTNKNTLAQKPLKLNKKTGREQTDESASYSVVFKPHEAKAK